MNVHSQFYHGDAFRIVRGASGYADKVVLVFQCYLDDSGTSGLPIITMAGFVAHSDSWEVVEAHLNKTMNEYQVPIFHAKEFHDTKKGFLGWSKIKKRTFAKELLADIKGKLFALSVTVRKKTFEQQKRDSGQFQNMSVYGLCFSNIVMKILMDPKIGPLVRKQGLSFLVEAGNNNNSEIEQSFHFASKHNAMEGALRSITFISKESCRAIQLADYWAFYSRRYMRDSDRFNGKLCLPMDFHLQNVHRNCQVWQQGLGNFIMKRVAKLSETNTFDQLLDAADAAAKQNKQK
jgi:hypothetical protein